MVNFLKSKKIYLVLFCLISFSNQGYTKITLKSNINKYELKPLQFYNHYICDNWTPSLFNPVLTVNEGFTDGYNLVKKKDIILKNYLYNNDEYNCILSECLFDNSYKTYISECLFTNSDFDNCLYGLAPSIPKTTEGLEKEEYNLAILKNNHDIDNKVFSFGKWEITDNDINSFLYFGDNHENFKSNEGYIGKCNITDDEYWGCSFKEMIFNNVNIPLTKDNTSVLYNIYFASEIYDIVFPNVFRNKFIEAANKKCQYHIYDKGYYLDCEGLDKKDYIPLKLINEDMNITAEIDYFAKYSKSNDTPKSKTRIKFQDIDYIIFPLIMFKHFHIEFDANKKTISFFTKNSSILELPKKPEEKYSVLLIILIILIVILSIAILVGIIILVRNTCSSDVEKDIHKFSKYEDEDFENMNERTVN